MTTEYRWPAHTVITKKWGDLYINILSSAKTVWGKTTLVIAANNYDSDNNCARHSRKSDYLHKVEIYYDDVTVVLQKLKLSLMSRGSTALRGLRFDACPGGSGSRVNGCGFGGWVWGGVSRGSPIAVAPALATISRSSEFAVQTLLLSQHRRLHGCDKLNAQPHSASMLIQC